MSRSIHTTRRDLKETKRFCYSHNNAEHRDARLKRLREQLTKKRRIKKQVLRERHRPAAPVPLPVETSSIPICVLDKGKFIHYPATAADIRGVMRLLPMGVLDGISSIDMCLGAEYQTDSSEQFKPDPDPFVGRHGYEMLPGVFQGKCLGVYLSHRARIRVFAYVYDSAMPDRQMWEVLKLDTYITGQYRKNLHNSAHQRDASLTVYYRT